MSNQDFAPFGDQNDNDPFPSPFDDDAPGGFGPLIDFSPGESVSQADLEALAAYDERFYDVVSARNAIDLNLHSPIAALARSLIRWLGLGG